MGVILPWYSYGVLCTITIIVMIHGHHNHRYSAVTNFMI